MIPSFLCWSLSWACSILISHIPIPDFFNIRFISCRSIGVSVVRFSSYVCRILKWNEKKADRQKTEKAAEHRQKGDETISRVWKYIETVWLGHVTLYRMIRPGILFQQLPGTSRFSMPSPHPLPLSLSLFFSRVRFEKKSGLGSAQTFCTLHLILPFLHTP